MSFPRITPQEALDLVENQGYTFLDVRSVPEFEAGHPAGAHNVPLMHKDVATGQMRPNTNFLEDVQARFPADTKLVIGCQAGGRSARAAALLLESGYSDIVDQRAGWGGERDMAGRIVTPGWEAAGLPTETGDGGERAYGPQGS